MMADAALITEEIAEHLFDGYTRRWSASRVERILSRRPIEPDISALITAYVDEAGIRATNFLAAAGGHSPDREHYDYYLVDAREPLVKGHLRKKRTDGSGRTAIHPDIFVCREPKETDRSEIVLAIELKRDAAVNYINCPTGAHADYSNQLVCYADGCWLAEPGNHPELTYVWLAPRTKLTDAAIEAKGLSSDPDRLARMHATLAAYERQLVALATKWHRTALEGLVEELRTETPNLAGIISSWGEDGRRKYIDRR